jgi:hypothetical protein
MRFDLLVGDFIDVPPEIMSTYNGHDKSKTMAFRLSTIFA